MSASDLFGDRCECPVSFAFIFEAVIEYPNLDRLGLVFLSNDRAGDGQSHITILFGLIIDNGGCTAWSQGFVVDRVILGDKRLNSAFCGPGKPAVGVLLQFVDDSAP